MKLDFYGLKEQPFGDIPDTRFLYVSSANGQALGSVLVALQRGSSAVSLIGQAGLGKTTLLYHMFNTFKDNVTTIYLFQPPQTPVDLLRSILADLGVREMYEIPQEMFSLLLDLLAEQTKLRKRVVVVIDQAQNLSPSVLEVLWMLSNPDSKYGRLLQFVLSGQSQLEEKMAAEGSTQLACQTPIVARLEPLSHEDTARYVDHRLRVAGYGDETPLFSPEASALIARYSEGVPRRINSLCYTSLSLAFEGKRGKIEADIVSDVAADLGLDRGKHRVLPSAAAKVVETRVAEPVAVAIPWYERTGKTQPPASLRGPQPVAPVPVEVKKTSRFIRMAPKLGLAAAVLLTAAATLVNVRRHMETPSAVVAPVETPAQAPAAKAITVAPVRAVPPAAAHAAVVLPHKAQRDLKGMNLQDAVRALGGRSLNDVCKANFGQCDSKQMQEIRGVNMRLGAHPHPATSQNAAAPPEKAALDATN